MRSTVLGILAVTAFASSAYAADLPVKAARAPAPEAVTAYNWTGWYVGGNVGYGWGRNSDPDVTFVDGSGIGVAAYFAAGGNVMPNVRQKGVIGGAQVGYNWMLAPTWVVGVVADIQASGMKASASAVVTPCVGCATSTQSNSVETDWFGTLRGKLGWAANNWLLYGTGGLAYGQVKASGAWTAATTPVVSYAGSVSSTRAGWAAGAGVNYALTRNWILGVEYLHIDLGHVSYTDVSTNGVATATTFTISNRAAADIVRGTLDYKF